MPLANHFATYAHEVTNLAASDTTNEGTYYPALRTLLTSILKNHGLPFDVRTVTSERRRSGGADQPDLAFYDGSGDFVALLGEVKLPNEDLEQLAVSTERNDQIGRYLAQTRVVLLCNIRAFGLLTVAPSFSGDGPVPPAHRTLEEVVELWPSVSSLRRNRPIAPEDAARLTELVDVAVTRFACISEPESLARILARQARRAKESLPAHFSRAVQGLLDDFTNALGIHFEGPEGEEFLRSSLIQTAFYGLFAGWALWWRSRRREPFRWEDLAHYLKIPFLGELFHEFRHPARIEELRLAEHLDHATETLSRVDTDSFFAKFSLATVQGEDQAPGGTATTAIMYFYEPFLEAFDPDLRKKLGVWYTPTEVVRYQVRKIDRLLREQLGCERGFADERVVVLDPCCGTGAYLIEVLRCIVSQLREEGVGALLGRKLLQAFCERVIGFEILTAPFVVARNFQLYIIFSELGAPPDERHRPAVFLTNSLTGWERSQQLTLHFPELQEEHDAAQKVKNEARIIVVLGNPPYDRWAQVPIDEEEELADRYKGIHRNAKGNQVGPSDLYTRWGIRKQLLNDLYIRFFRLAEKCIGERAEFGVVSFISNYSFYAHRSHPIMRESLLRSFHEIWIDCLNGDKYATGKVVPKGQPGEGTTDQSVFTTEYDPRGIQPGTGITTLLKRVCDSESQAIATVRCRDFWGRSADKRRALLESLDMVSWPAAKKKRAAAARPEGPREYEVFLPSEDKRWKLLPYSVAGGFGDWPSLDDLFPVSFQGVNHNRGIQGALIETERDVLRERMRDYFSDTPFETFEERHPVLCTPRARYDPRAVREKLRQVSAFREDHIVPYVLFPLDQRWIYYETEAKLLNERRQELWDNLANNTFLVTVPEPRRVSESRPLLATSLFNLHLHDRGSVAFPVHVLPEPEAPGLFAQSEEDTRPRANIADGAWEALKAYWNLRGDAGGQAAVATVRTLFHFAAAVCHAPAYEEEHKASLAKDWAHIPIPKDRNLLNDLARLGERIGALLNPLVDPTSILRATLGKGAATLGVVQKTGRAGISEADLVVTYSYYGGASGRWVERAPGPQEAFRPCWGETTGDLFLNETVFLSNVPEKVWRYELGGYPVLKKWLGYRDAGRREGQPLCLAEMEHLRSMVLRLSALLAIHDDLDRAYEKAIANPFLAEELGL